jgi:hypothetical protein
MLANVFYSQVVLLYRPVDPTGLIAVPSSSASIHVLGFAPQPLSSASIFTVLHNITLPHNRAVLHNLVVALHSLRLSSPTRLPAETVTCLRLRPDVASQFLHEITNVNRASCQSFGRAHVLRLGLFDLQSQTQPTSLALRHRYQSPRPIPLLQP